MKYFITNINTKRHQNAGGKANHDMDIILQNIGYKPLSWRVSYPVHLIKYAAEFFFYQKILRTTTKDDTILLQWPDYTIRYPKKFYKILAQRPHLEILIHDINILRQEFARCNECERDYFLLAEKIIVHTQAMRDYVCSLGVKKENIRILTAFDYLSDDEMITCLDNSKEVVFAGNLEKSTFLKDITKEKFGDTIVLNCYGRRKGNIGDCCEYKGCFSPEHTSDIKGSWGLVWDGDSLDCCSGNLGEYLKFNSPHKLSLYLCSGIPVIVWKEAALADYILENNLGIVVGGIGDIPKAIASISAEEYSAIVDSVKAEGERLRNGMHLKTCLQ